ncbi:MAG: 3-hydroxyacyl-CoA dehydrogenase/enoyl-CoA hydratase family protein [Candidatus Methanodesulfokora sp.]
MVRKAAVIGAGTMGHGIAEVLAINGIETNLVDIKEDILRSAMEKIGWSLRKLHEKGRISRSPEEVISLISTFTSIKEAVRDVDLVIEAVPEIFELKKQVFSEIDANSRPDAVIATNTSSIPISELALCTRRPDKVLGLHFFNPPVVMQLVEVVRGRDTSDDVVKQMMEFVRRIGKKPVLVRRDIPGFIVNRIMIRLLNTACILVRRGIYSVEEVDSALRKIGFPMGAFELSDYIGIDVLYFIIESVRSRGMAIESCQTFKEMMDRGKLGVKTGDGFYRYPSPGTYKKPDISAFDRADPVLLISPAVNEASYLLREGISSLQEINEATILGLGYPKGIFQYADEMGIDAIVSSLRKLSEITGSVEFSPDPLLLKMLELGRIGTKSGFGFHEYFQEKQMETIKILYRPPVAVIQLNRPEKLNSISRQMLDELKKAMLDLSSDANIRAVVMTGTGRAFSSGADISEFLQLSPEEMMGYSEDFKAAVELIEKSPKPIIAAINGYCLGGGLEIALGCDIRLAAESARLGQPEVNIGLIPGGGATKRLPLLIGASRAKLMIMTGEHISAQQAERMGLVDMVVRDDLLMMEAVNLCLKIASKPEKAIWASKIAVNSGSSELESALFGILSMDAKDRIKAFLEKKR